MIDNTSRGQRALSTGALYAHRVTRSAQACRGRAGRKLKACGLAKGTILLFTTSNNLKHCAIDSVVRRPARDPESSIAFSDEASRPS